MLVFLCLSLCKLLQMNTLKPRIASLLQQLNERVFEKEHVVALALLSAVAGQKIRKIGEVCATVSITIKQNLTKLSERIQVVD